MFVSQVYSQILDLLQLGGPVLWVLLLLCFLMWLLIFERLYFIFVGFRQKEQTYLKEWSECQSQESWQRRDLRDYFVSDAKSLLGKNISLIRLCIALCPMFGLLGTVVGMISVFDTISVFGTSDSRALSSGISMATIPTVVGITIALTGYYFHLKLASLVKARSIQLSERMSAHA